MLHENDEHDYKSHKRSQLVKPVFKTPKGLTCHDTHLSKQTNYPSQHMLINADIQGDKHRGEKMLQDPRLHRDRVRVPRRDSYEKRPVLSATIHPDIKRTLMSMSERTGMTVSQVADEVLYTGLIEMQELDLPED